MSRFVRLASSVLAIGFLLGTSTPMAAQYFGRNKVQYKKLDFQVLKTEHFDIHFYPEEEAATQEAARMAERWYTRLSSIFGREFSERKTIIFYADQADFQQTTVSRGLIGEGTSPCSTMRSRFACGSAIGAAAIKACV